MYLMDELGWVDCCVSSNGIIMPSQIISQTDGAIHSREVELKENFVKDSTSRH